MVEHVLYFIQCMRYSYYSIVVTVVYQKLDVSGLFSSKCRHVDREEKRIVQRRSQS